MQPRDESGEDAASFLVELQRLAPLDPFRWIALGWRDFRQAPRIGLFFGACFVGMGWALLTVFENAPAYVLGLSAGFLLLGPFLCMGLYYASEQLALGQRPSLPDAILAWRRKADTLAIFGVVLLVLELLWGRASLVVFALSFQGMPDFKGSVLKLLDPANAGFIVAYLAVGGVFAAIIFAVSVVSIPMILDRQADAITAGLTSIRLVVTQPVVMILWGALITLIVAVSLLPGFLGLLVTGPVLGHASWHAYRAAVGAPPP
jgi:uncharacterized membrane protein